MADVTFGSPLSRQALLDILGYSIWWEANPAAEFIPLGQFPVREDQEPAAIKKSTVIARIKSHPQLGFSDRPDDFFNTVGGWEEVRRTVDGFLTKGLEDTQPVAGAKEEVAAVSKPAPHLIRQPGPSGQTKPTTQPAPGAKSPAFQKTMASIESRAAMSPTLSFWRDPLGGLGRLGGQFRAVIFRPAPTVVSEPTSTTVVASPGGGRAPRGFFTGIKNMFGGGKGGKQQVGGLAKNIAENKLKEGTAAAGTKAVAGKALGAVSGPLGWAMLILSNKTLRNVLLATGTALSLLLLQLINFLTTTGAIFAWAGSGALVGFAIFGPVGGIVGGVIGLGGYFLTSSGVGTSIASASSAISAGMGTFFSGVGGFIGGASTGFVSLLGGASVSSVAVWGVFGATASAFLMTLLATGFVIGTFQSAPAASAEQPTIVTVTISADKLKLNNNSNEKITYKITVSTNSKKDVTVSLSNTLSFGSSGSSGTSKNISTLPDLDDARACGKIPTTVPANSTVEICYKPYAVLPDWNDSYLTNSVSVKWQQDSSSGDVDPAQVVTIIGGGSTIPGDETCPIAPEGNGCSVAALLPLKGIDNNQAKAVAASRRCFAESINGPAECRCALGPAGNVCSTQNMSRFFGSDQTTLEKASRICYRETGGVATTVNDGCKHGYTNEYSVGVFQINLFAHDDFCKRYLPKDANGQPQNPFNEPYCGTNCGNACNRNEALLQQCADYWAQSDNNIQAAKELSGGGQKWSSWSTAKRQYCNIP